MAAHEFMFKGCVDTLPDKGDIGDIVHNREDNCEYVYDSKQWTLLDVSLHDPEIKRFKCKSCGAILPVSKVTQQGMCTCRYCRQETYIW